MAAAGTASAVYWTGTTIHVRSAYAPKIVNAEIVCLAQAWDEKTVQLRFSGAGCEWVAI